MKKLTKAQEVFRDYSARGSLLDEREKEILRKYYGFDGEMRHTLAEISKDYKITRERIRQIKHHAEKKIKSEGKVDR